MSEDTETNNWHGLKRTLYQLQYIWISMRQLHNSRCCGAVLTLLDPSGSPTVTFILYQGWFIFQPPTAWPSTDLSFHKTVCCIVWKTIKDTCTCLAACILCFQGKSVLLLDAEKMYSSGCGCRIQRERKKKRKSEKQNGRGKTALIFIQPDNVPSVFIFLFGCKIRL